jgi:hypothetical protein
VGEGGQGGVGRRLCPNNGVWSNPRHIVRSLRIWRGTVCGDLWFRAELADVVQDSKCPEIFAL